MKQHSETVMVWIYQNANEFIKTPIAVYEKK